MGYRSDVTLGVNKDCFEKHKTKELIDALQHCDIIRENDTINCDFGRKVNLTEVG